MTTDERIAELERKCADLQEQLNMAYDDLDRRIERGNSDRLTICGIIVALVVGGVQIVRRSSDSTGSARAGEVRDNSLDKKNDFG